MLGILAYLAALILTNSLNGLLTRQSCLFMPNYIVVIQIQSEQNPEQCYSRWYVVVIP